MNKTFCVTGGMLTGTVIANGDDVVIQATQSMAWARGKTMNEVRRQCREYGWSIERVSSVPA